MNITEYIHSYLACYRNYKDYWNYEDGCILTGCSKLFRATGDIFYRDFVLNYLSEVIAPDGTILTYDNSKNSLDSFNSGRSLIFAYEITGEEKYRKALDFLYGKITSYPRTAEESFIHKSIYPDQIWLDGLYMVHPLYAAYTEKFGNGSYDDILIQFKNARNRLFDDSKMLYRHGYDSARIQPWADNSTGMSESFWLRSQGWFLMALTDTAHAVKDRESEIYKYLRLLFKEAADGILSFADRETGLFYQVTDRSGDSDNYTETSGSLMISYALIRGYHIGFAGREYADRGREIFDSIIKHKMKATDRGMSLTDICMCAGLGPGNTRNGSAEYYYSESRVSDDPKGVGPLMMALSEIIKDDSLSGGNTYEG